LQGAGALPHGLDARPALSDTLELDLGTVEPTVARPKRPQDRVPLAKAKASFAKVVEGLPAKHAQVKNNGDSFDLSSGAVVIAAITSCTNTSNPSLMLGAGLLAKKAVERGLQVKPWVKTSLAPGSKVVTDYLAASGLKHFSRQIKIQSRRVWCTTCIGNSGPLPDAIGAAIKENNLVAVAVLSGNRNFEGRIHPLVRATISHRRRSSSPMRLPAAWISISLPSRSAKAPTGSRCISATFGRHRKKSKQRFAPR